MSVNFDGSKLIRMLKLSETGNFGTPKNNAYTWAPFLGAITNSWQLNSHKDVKNSYSQAGKELITIS